MTAPPHLSETQVIERIEARLERTPRSRRIEDALAIVGLLQAAIYGLAESLASVGWRLGECKAETGIPWVTLAILFACVLPKTVGRATTGRIWEMLGARVGGKP